MLLKKFLLYYNATFPSPCSIENSNFSSSRECFYSDISDAYPSGVAKSILATWWLDIRGAVPRFVGPGVCVRDDGGKEGRWLGGRESKAREAGVTGGWWVVGGVHALCSAVNGVCVAPTANGSKLGERKGKTVQLKG